MLTVTVPFGLLKVKGGFMEINKQIFGNRTYEQIPLPTNRIRVINGKRQIHFYTFEEFKIYFATGELKVLDDEAWTDLTENPTSATTSNPRYDEQIITAGPKEG